jgi:hypothetical protein
MERSRTGEIFDKTLAEIAASLLELLGLGLSASSPSEFDVLASFDLSLDCAASSSWASSKKCSSVTRESPEEPLLLCSLSRRSEGRSDFSSGKTTVEEKLVSEEGDEGTDEG